jgi:hypothetical protein
MIARRLCGVGCSAENRLIIPIKKVIKAENRTPMTSHAGNFLIVDKIDSGYMF